ncbi:MAG: TetR/AcrR family transcriptional regulator [Dehalococcoidia bacterium]
MAPLAGGEHGTGERTVAGWYFDGNDANTKLGEVKSVRRPYRLRARALTAEATEQHILAAAQQLFGERLYDQVTLQAVALRAGVTVQTVIRRFGSKEQLFAAVASWKSSQIRGARDAVPAGDLSSAVRALTDCYEQWGDDVLHLLAQEQRTAAVRAVTTAGREYHHAWVERVFAPLLPASDPAERRRQLAQLTAVTDLYTWKVLRRDCGLGEAEVEAAVRDLIRKLVG